MPVSGDSTSTMSGLIGPSKLSKRRLTVFTGVSGSGKSSLVFDTIAAESQRLIRGMSSLECRLDL